MRLFTRYFVLIFLTALAAFTARGSVTANFTVDYVAGCAPLVVHFTNTSTPIAGSTFDWDLGNGSGIIHLTDCSGSYLTPGTTYTVTLTAHNGGSTSVKTMIITVYPSPTVSFTASDTTICPGSSVTFTSSSLGGVPGPVTCTWNFGDGFSGTGNPVSHTYTASGFYNVTLSVTNADGCVSSLTKPVYMEVYTPAAPYFTAPTTYYCKAPGHVVFSNLTSGTGPFTYIWRFGDGSPPSTLTAPVHDYPLPGSYNITLIVTDGHGCTDSVVIPGYITVGNLHAAFTLPSTACVNSLVTFPNTSSSHTGSSWDYGDGNSGTTDPGSNTYRLPGVYHVRLIVFDGYCYDTVYHDITITPGPTVSFTISPLHPCPPPTLLTFTGTVPPGTTVTWLYGDWTTGAGVTSSHTFWHRGVDTARMIAVDAAGCRDTVQRLDTLYDMVHWITANPYSGCKPLSVDFSSHKITYEPPDTTIQKPYPFPTISWSWNFGDGSATSVSPTPTHIYTAVGVYLVVLTTVTSNGCTIYDSTYIRVGQPPQVTFTVTPTHQCYHGNLVYFTATIITGPVDSFVWAYGDGTGQTTGTGVTSHHYTLPGFFTNTLTPYYNGCPGSPYASTVVVTIDSPMAIVHDSIFCSPARRVQFADSSLGDDTHIWSFGDGFTSTADNPIHDYAAPIVYTVTISTYNNTSHCRDTAVLVLDLHRPVPFFSTTDTTVCRDSLVYFTSTIIGGTASAYYWHTFGWSSDSSSSTLLDTFHVPGIWPVTLIIIDQNGCLDTMTRDHYILVSKPVARFTVSPPSGCWPLTAVFTDASTGVIGTFMTGFEWAFGDGGSAFVTTPSVTHVYTAAGSFSTRMIVRDNIGCRDTVTAPSVTVWRPSAVFNCSNVHPCRYDVITFNNTSTGIVSSFWMFGDGGTSTLNSPTHFYTTAGAFTVKLVVTDAHGCTDTATYVNYINIIQPVAGFYMDDSVSVCPPLFVHFLNTTTGGLFYNWTFGDGSSSTIPFPSDLYITTGFDTVRLIASNIYGCRDTVFGHVTIFGYAGAFSYSPLSGCSPLTVHFRAATLNVPNIIWDFSDGNTSTVSYTDSISHTYLLPGAYVPKLILSDNTGCQNSSVGLDTIKVDMVYPGFKIIPNPVCLGDTFMLADSSGSYWSAITGLNWTINGTTSTVDSPRIFINSVGTYPATLLVTDGWGCTGTAIKDITIYPLPVITVSPDTVICVGDYATLQGYGGATYTWAPAGTLSCTNCNPTRATPPVVTTYTVTGKDIHGCTGTDTVTVFLKTNTVSIARGDTEICDGAVVPLYDSGGTKYQWIPATGLSNPNIANPMAHPDVSTKYMVISQLGSCIPDTNFVTVIVHPVPDVDAGPDQTLIAGSVAQITTSGRYIYKYMWDNKNTLSCDTCADPVATMSVTTTYRVKVSSDFGCLNSDSVTIHIFCDNSQIFIPNSFTPNGDGQNDVFYPRGTGVSKIKSFRIYNRWGQLLFERSGIDINDASNAWDGSYMGDKPKPDVYVYVVDAICETGEPLFIKGDVTIIR